jgi:hypothetical protein
VLLVHPPVVIPRFAFRAKLAQRMIFHYAQQGAAGMASGQ